MPITDRRTVMQTAVAVPIAMAATGPAFPRQREPRLAPTQIGHRRKA